MGEKPSDCYIEVWRDVDFGGERVRIYGPAVYPVLRLAEGHWGDDIGSLRVGPNAFVLAYRDRDFKDELMTFGPNDEIADLRKLKFNDDIESMNVIDSLKIFDRLTYNSADGRTSADAGAAGRVSAVGGGSAAPAAVHVAPKPGRPGKKNRRGRRR